MKEPLQLRSLVQIRMNTQTGSDYDEQFHDVPEGELIFVMGHLDENEDALHRFVGLWEGMLLKFYLFPSEVKQL